MKKNKIYILTFIFVLLLLLVVGRSYLANLLSSKTSYYQEAVASFSKESVEKIKIDKDGDTANLVKKDDQWTINEKKADSDRINDLLDTLIPKESVEVVAETSIKHEEMGVSQELATKITLNDSLVILLGKTGTSGTFARMKDNDTVFSLPKTLVSDISAHPEDWFDKQIVAVDEKNIGKLTFQKKDEKIVLVKKDNSWIIEGSDKKIDQSNLGSIFLSLSSLQAKSVVEDENISNYQSTPSLTLTIDFDARQETLSLRKGKEDYLVERQSDGEKFLLSTYQAEKFYISEKDLVKKEKEN